MINEKTKLFTYNGFITTMTRREISFLEPTKDMVWVDDIVAGLSHNYRWNGQCPTQCLMTVAQHSCMVYKLVEEKFGHKPISLIALLHDAPEAYTGDIGKPLKVLLGNIIKIVEGNLLRAIIDKIAPDLPFSYVEDCMLTIKQFDRQMQQMEWDYI